MNASNDPLKSTKHKLAISSSFLQENKIDWQCLFRRTRTQVTTPKKIGRRWKRDKTSQSALSFLPPLQKIATTKKRASLIYRHWYRHTPRYNPKVQYAFKISMTHWILQFALRIAVRSVLHRCASLDIHCWKLLSSLKARIFILTV